VEFNQTLYILAGQSLFFVVILALCLKLAVNRHRAHLRKIVEQVNKTAASQAPEGKKKQSSQQIRELLMKKIQQLQTKNTALEKMEVQHNKLKEKYESLRLNLLKRPGEASDLKPGPVGKLSDTITETKKDRFLRKMKNLNEASGATGRASSELRNIDKINLDQRDTIEILRAKVKRYEIESDLNKVQVEKKDAALDALDALEGSLLESQATSEKLEGNLASLRREFNRSQQEVDRLEKTMKQSEQDRIRDKKTGEKKSYTLISKENPIDNFEEEKDDFEIEAIQNYHSLKKEVQRLRSNTSEQRRMIFVLEGELVALRKELDIGGLSQEDQEEKEVQLVKLEKLLEETEGCVGMLEDEITYLQERIETMSSDSDPNDANHSDVGQSALDEEDSGADTEESPAEISKELQFAQGELKNALLRFDQEAKMRGQLSEAISTLSETKLNLKVPVITTHIVEALENFSDQVYVKIASQHGEIDASSSKKINSASKAGLASILKQSAVSRVTEYDVIERNQELLVAHKKIGAYIKTEQKDHDELEQIRGQIEYVLVVADSMVTAIEDGRALKHQKSLVQHLIQRVKKNISTRAVQRKYQSTEANKAVSDFLVELLTSLQTMNLTENQSKFFEEMINEIKERMYVLFESEITVDTAFAEFIDKLDRDEKQSVDQA